MLYPKINLHIHSSHSDGLLPVEQLVRIMRETGYDIIALTDHDTVAGNAEAERICADFGICFIPGVELTTYLANEIRLLDTSYKVHIVGLNINSVLIHSIVQQTENRKVDFHKQVLKQWFSEKEICAFDLHNRIACAEQLVRKEIFDSIEEALPLFPVSSYCLSIPETIRAIHDAGGVAIWAHPFLLPHNGGHRITQDAVQRILIYMKSYQLDGMEAYYASFDTDDQAFIANLCKENGLLCSTGTDFHGDYPLEFQLLERRQKVDMQLLTRICF